MVVYHVLIMLVNVLDVNKDKVLMEQLIHV